MCVCTCEGPARNQDRIWHGSEVDAAGCWLWQGKASPNGYGFVKVGNVRLRAHRVSYEAFVGPIPEGLVIDHLCRVRNCVNPEHLEAVTEQVNQLRGETISARNAAKTHCPRGHEYSEDNTYLNYKGGRECRLCRRIRPTLARVAHTV